MQSTGCLRFPFIYPLIHGTEQFIHNRGRGMLNGGPRYETGLHCHLLILKPQANFIYLTLNYHLHVTLHNRTVNYEFNVCVWV